MNVLSLFDGMSCGQIALERVGIKVDNYFASEIDTNAIKVTQYNYPNTIQIGDVRNIISKDFPKIDLLIGGSPCQSFSFAGKGKGMITKNEIEILNLEDYLKLKEEGFEFDGQSYLFWEYVRLLNELKPKWFLLENVKMNKKWKEVITDAVGIEPILINSALVSAQNRERLYWTNIPNVNQPKDKGVLLKDILEIDYNILKKYKVNKTPSRIKMWEGKCKNITNSEKSSCLVTKQDRWNSQGLIEFEDFCRFLTPLENERLQTVPDNYTSVVKDKERDKMLGNGWTVDVIGHIFKNLKTDL